MNIIYILTHTNTCARTYTLTQTRQSKRAMCTRNVVYRRPKKKSIPAKGLASHSTTKEPLRVFLDIKTEYRN